MNIYGVKNQVLLSVLEKTKYYLSQTNLLRSHRELW